MHGIEIEEITVNDRTIEYIIPFVGREVPWWNGLTNSNIYTGESFKMVPTVIDNITLEDIRSNTNVANIVVSKNPYYLPTEYSYEPSEDVFYLARVDTNKVLNPSVSTVYEVIQHEEVLNRAEKLRESFPDKLRYYSSGVLFN